MTTATAPAISREVLQDRWDAVMEWERTGGNPSDEYEDLVRALYALAVRVAGHDATETNFDTPDDDLLFEVGSLVINDVQRLGIAR